MAKASIAGLLLDLARIKALEDELAKQKAAVQESLVTALKAVGQKTASATTDNGDSIKGTLVEAQRVTYDEDRLKKALGAPVWKKVTKQVLDKQKLEAEITVGAVDPNVVAGCASVADNKPYVKVTGSYSPSTLVDLPIGEVTIKNASGATKPAAKRVKPRKK
jgi:hypothetical protein